MGLGWWCHGWWLVWLLDNVVFVKRDVNVGMVMNVNRGIESRG